MCTYGHILEATVNCINKEIAYLLNAASTCIIIYNFMETLCKCFPSI